jgi:Holliday junction DNA helicase RuvA
VIALLEGQVAARGADRAVILAGGVGYEINCSAATLGALPSIGRRTKVLTHLHVRDDSMSLFGFGTLAERDLFTLLIGVNGVGPKLALAILSVLAPEALRRALLDGDADAVTVVPGVGKKVAARIVLDLKERLGGQVDLPAESPLAEVREALMGMGLSVQEVQDALAGLDGKDGPVEELLRGALQRVGSR